MIVVSNSTPLIGLAKIDKLHLLREMFGTIYIPQSVYDEVVTNAKGRPGAEEVGQASWIHTQSASDSKKVDYLRVDLDAGEAEALVLAEEIKADWILLDENKARLTADLIGLSTIGTVGILLLAKRMEKISVLKELLDELKAERFFISEEVYKRVLDQAGESFSNSGA